MANIPGNHHVTIEQGPLDSQQKITFNTDGRQPLQDPTEQCGVCPKRQQVTWSPLAKLANSALNGKCLSCVMIYEGLRNLGTHEQLIELGFAEVKIDREYTGDQTGIVQPGRHDESERGDQSWYELISPSNPAPMSNDNYVPAITVPIKIAAEKKKGRLSSLLNLRKETAVQQAYTWPPDTKRLQYSPVLPDLMYQTSANFMLDEPWSWLEKECILDCMISHHQCRVPDDPILPTRVLDLDSYETSRKVHLCINVDGKMRGAYLCLSHCWGKDVAVKTLRSNIDGRIRNGIHFSQLPKTFQDAVLVTHRLKYRYLWIDALCIIQDDPNDWSHEAGTMCNVYRNAVITIAATSSEDSHGGLLKPARKYHGFRVYHPDRNKKVYFREHQAHAHHTGYSRGGFGLYNASTGQSNIPPLLKRAWVFQERHLSPRMIHFGNEIVWECRERTTCECGALNANIPAVKGGLHTQPAPTAKAAEIWRNIVISYSQLKLSKHEDILSALAGLARQHAQSRNIRYLAGIWDDDLLHYLTWHVDEYPVPPCASIYCAPSWSWAAQTGSVKFARLDNANREARILKVEAPPQGTDPFGAVKGGILEIEGPFLEVEIHWPEERFSEHPQNRSHTMHQTLRKDGQEIWGFHWDYWPDTYYLRDVVLREGKAYCLLIGYESAHVYAGEEPWSLWLVLWDNKRPPGFYQRFGFLMTKHLRKEMGRVRRITIV